MLTITGTEDPLTLAKKLNANFLANTMLPLPFRPGVPLYGMFVFPAQTLSTPVVFVPEPGAIAGSACGVKLTSDGVHIPVFAGGFQQAAGAAGGNGWSNSNGVINTVCFWFDDGGNFWYSVSH